MMFGPWLDPKTNAVNLDAQIKVRFVDGTVSECRAARTFDFSDGITHFCVAMQKGKEPAANCTPSAPGILQQAAATMEARAAQYDKPEGERSMGAAVSAFNIVTGRDLRESEGWLLLQILKDVRDNQTVKPHEDSLIDCVAYSTLKAEARIAGR